MTGTKTLSGVPDDAWYRGCAPTSATNIIRYWRVKGWSLLIPPATADTFVIDDLANNYFFTNSSGGTLTLQALAGMQNYWTAKGYGSMVETNYGGTSDRYPIHVSQIDANRPTWIFTAGHPVYGDHAITGIGYETTSTTNMAIVHDTWGHGDYKISWDNTHFSNVITIVPEFS